MKPAFALDEASSAVLGARLLQGLVAKPAAVSWAGELQPVPLHRARVRFDRFRTYAYTRDVDAVYRDELRMRWRAAHLVSSRRPPLEGDLAAVLTFAGNSRGNRRRPDATNLAKAVEDAANPSAGWRGLWLDDRQVVLELAWISAWGPDVQPRVTLDLWRLG